MTTALVLGGAGWLSRNLIPKLLERGYEVHSVDHRNDAVPEMIGLVKHTMKFDSWWRCTALETFDYVFHLAAELTQYNIDERNKMSMEAFSDTQLDYEVAHWLERCRPKERLVWMSSCATDAKDTEVYAFCKYVSERFARHLGRHGYPIAILKPYGGYGPGQSLKYPFPAILDRALRKEDPLCVWGNVHSVRDWIYIDDLVEAILMAADGKFPNAGAIPIGTGRPTTFAQLAELIAKQIGYSPQIKADFSKPVGSSHRVAVAGIAKSFGFEAKVTLEEGVARCVAAVLGDTWKAKPAP